MDLNKVSKFISLLLRHKPEEAGLTLDKNGWVPIKDLIVGCNKKGYTIVLHDLLAIVSSDSKNRYEISMDLKNIRARQGHTVEIDAEFKEAKAPDTLYHGTTLDVIPLIEKEGIKKMARHHVHLSPDIKTATDVAKRRRSKIPVILHVNSKQMQADGIKFYISSNDVWLVDAVNYKYVLAYEDI
jgi:putative RNA 2'-phosphotransferase